MVFPPGGTPSPAVIKYNNPKIIIHTISTKCQYSPAISKSTALSLVKLPLNSLYSKKPNHNIPNET